MLEDEEVRKLLSAPAVIALSMAAIRFMLTGGRESPLRVLGFLVGAAYLAYLLGPYMADNDWSPAEISLASAAIGFVIPNIAMGVIELSKRIKDDPAGFLVDILKRFSKK